MPKLKYQNNPMKKIIISVLAIKTGTLTKNKMYVEKIFLDDKWYERTEFKSLLMSEEKSLLIQALYLNNNTIEDAEKRYNGDSTEIALLELAKEFAAQSAETPRLAEIEFDSDRKLMTTFHHYKNKIISFTKGAPDVLLKRCVNVDINKLQQQVDEMASQGLRVLGFAYHYWDLLPEKINSDIHENGFVFFKIYCFDRCAKR